MFTRGQYLLEYCRDHQVPIWQAVLTKESQEQEKSETELMTEIQETLEVMKKSAHDGINEPTISLTGMTGGNAYKLREYMKKNETLSGSMMVQAMAMALSTSEVNAAMGKIVAAPTAGASGIVPATLFSLQDQFQFSDDDLIKGLLTASTIGNIIAVNASISGAMGGCQAECGSAASMAAAAAVELKGGSPEMALDGASFALIHVMGLVCDPVAGLVEFPCAFRNASGVTNALISADLALAGIKSLVPFDEVVDAMNKVGNMMNYTLKETALGGVAATETGKKLAEKYIKE